MPATSTFFGSKPRSALTSLMNVRISKPAPSSRTIESATWATTRPARMRVCRRPPVERAVALAPTATSRRALCSAGKRPKPIVATAAAASANRSTGRSSLICVSQGTPCRGM